MVLEILGMLSSWSSYNLIFTMVFMFSFMLMNINLLNWGFIYSSNLFQIKMSLSNLNLIPFCMVLFISTLVFWWASYYMQSSSSTTFFFVLLSMFVSSMLLLLLSESLMMIFIGWEGLGITSFVLIIYYQNWMSFQGGLLTLLTNRIGDAVLMLIFSYWILQSFYAELSMETTVLLGFLLFFLTLTKSAQTPFTSWLPAAMAAPTPVSSLVHSSTLVTAGVWLMIKFSQKTFFLSSLWIFIGMMTLSLASMAALVETDAKKIVALSTLSQLGLMFMALMMGGYFICLFHLVMHAFAKANLFLMVGNLIHSRFSLQDIRFMSTGSQSIVYLLMIIISIFSLSGIVFTSGFFSKDFILMAEFSGLNSFLSSVIFVVIISMTLTYCSKFLILSLSDLFNLEKPVTSMSKMMPSNILSMMSIMSGLWSFKNLTLVSISNLSGFYWMYLLLPMLTLMTIFNEKWASLFVSQQILVKSLNYLTLILFKKLLMTHNTFLDMNYKNNLFLIFKEFNSFYRNLSLISILTMLFLMI